MKNNRHPRQPHRRQISRRRTIRRLHRLPSRQPRHPLVPRTSSLVLILVLPYTPQPYLLLLFLPQADYYPTMITVIYPHSPPFPSILLLPPLPLPRFQTTNQLTPLLSQNRWIATAPSNAAPNAAASTAWSTSDRPTTRTRTTATARSTATRRITTRSRRRLRIM